MKRIFSIIFAMFMGLALAIGGGVLLTGCGDKDNASISQEETQNPDVQGEATIPSRTQFYLNANGGTIVYPTYEIGEVSLTNFGYGFSVNSRGYFESQNKGVNNSYAMMKISFNAKVSSTKFTIRYISYGENNFDYAIFGNLDSTLSENNNADSTYYKRTYGESSPAEKSITYTMSAGAHYIYVKYRKDGSNHNNDDTLQLFFESSIGNSSTTQAWKWQFEGMQYGTLPTAYRQSYSFGGWYTSSGTLVTGASIYNSNQTLYARWEGGVRYPVYFDENYDSSTVNLYNIQMSYIENNLTENSGRYTSAVVSGNEYSYFKLQKYENGSYVSQIERGTVGILTNTIEKTVSNTKVRMGFNGNTADACINIDMSCYQNGTYVISVEILSFSANTAKGGTFGNIKIEKASSYSRFTAEGVETYTGSPYNYYRALPTPTRTGYTFNGWYRKKNYLDMDAMMAFLNIYNGNNKIDKGSDGVYSWNGQSAREDDHYRIFPVSLTIGATYRLSFMARSSENGSEKSTGLIPIDKNFEWYANGWSDCYVTNDTTWRWYETTFTVDSNFGGFSCGWWMGTRSFFKNIRLERMDTSDFETKVSTGDTQPLMSSHTLYASWSANTYTVTFNGNGATSGSMANRTWSYDNWNSVSNGFSKAGYTFAGWSVSTGSSCTHYYGTSTTNYSTTTSSSFTHNITGTGYYKNLRTDSGTVTFTAQWKANSYTVTFNANGGYVSPTSKSVTYGNTYGALPTPTRAYYTASAWRSTYNLIPNSTAIINKTQSEWTGGWCFYTLKDNGINLVQGKTYRLSFDMRLNSTSNITQNWNQTKLFINENTSGTLTNADGTTTLKNVTTSWQRYTGTFIYRPDTTSGYRNDPIHIYPNYSDATLPGQITNITLVEDSINSTTTVTTAANHTLTVDWTPIQIKNTVHLRVINMNGTWSDVDENAGGYVEVSRWKVRDNIPNWETYTQSNAYEPYTYVHQGQEFKIKAHANSGYIFAGFSTSPTPSYAIKNPSSAPSTTVSYYPTSDTHYYVYFKKLSENQLKYDETDKYFYFEDGYYPQSEARQLLFKQKLTFNGTYNSGAGIYYFRENYNYSIGEKFIFSVRYLGGSVVNGQNADFFIRDVAINSKNLVESNGMLVVTQIVNSEFINKFSDIAVGMYANTNGATFNNFEVEVSLEKDLSGILESSAEKTGESLNYTLAKGEEWVANGDNYYLIDKSKGYTDKLTVNLWAYKDNWNITSGETIISWTNDGGWSFQLNSGGAVGYLSAEAMKMGVWTYTPVRFGELSKISSGWHMLTLTFDGRYLKAYLDASLYETIDWGTNSTIRPEWFGADIVVGAECGYNSTNTPDGNNFHGKVRNVTIENEAFSASQIEALFGDKMQIPVYTCGGDRFVKISMHGQVKWFKFEPIRWRVSDYGVENSKSNFDRYSTLLLFKNYASYSSYFVAVSDLILGVGAMHDTRSVREGDSVADMTGFQNIKNTTNGVDLQVHYNCTDDIITIDNYSDYDQGNTVIHDGGLYEEPLRICSTGELEDVGLINRGARASDMVAFILGLDKDQVSYWTRDLSNLGAGVAITPTGTQIRPWLDQVLGMRFSYTFKEGSSPF